MTADPLAGLILAGFEGTHIDDPGVQALLELEVGGFILFGRNVESPEQVHSLLAGLREATSGRSVFFAVDQEGGRVARLRSPLTVWPPMAEVGHLGDEETAEAVGQALASEIGALGFNLVFAPVLDVRFEGTTDAIGDRSLGTDTTEVASLGSALIRGIQAAGLLACGKHFPGHGHVRVDSHLELPVCRLSREELMRDHVSPFRAASKAGVASIMTAHVHYPEVDSNEPATFSRTWLHEVLREDVGFGGLVLTDDLEMGAVTGSGRVADAAVRAIQAGADGLLICRDIEAIRESIHSLRRSADDDVDFLAACVGSLARLQQAASRHAPQDVPRAELDAQIGTPAHQRLADSLRSNGPGLGADPTEPSAAKSPEHAGTS